MRKILIAIVVLLALGAGLWFITGRDEAGAPPGAVVADANAPLAFVPADTPYVFANLQRMPKATVEAFLQQSEPAIKVWRSQFDLISARVAAEAKDEPGARWLAAIDAEFRDKTLVEAIAALGLDMQAYSAIYGVGLVPVARMTLADPAAFRAFIARLEERSGEKLATGTLDDVDFWQIPAPDAPLRGILALQGNHVVLTVAPNDDDAALRILLGIERPARSLSDGGALVAINQTYGYTPYATGYFDSARIVALFTAPSTPLEDAFLRALDVKKPAIDAVCQTEYAALAAVAPRLVVGYTRLEPKASEAISRLELRKDIAQDLMSLRAPMPGLAAADTAALNFGLSLRLGAVPALVNKWAAAVSKAPYACESLKPLNDRFAEASTQASNPMLFAAAPVFHGVHAIITRFDMASFDTAPDVSGKLLIGSPNPAALLGMARSFAPPLASLDLKPDGELRPLPAIDGLPRHLPAHVAMSDTLLGLAVGQGEEASLKAAMTSDAAHQPLMVLGYSGAAFTEFAENMARTMAAIPDPDRRAESEQSLEMMRQMYALIERIEMRVEFDEHGVAIHQSAKMH